MCLKIQFDLIHHLGSFNSQYLTTFHVGSSYSYFYLYIMYPIKDGQIKPVLISHVDSIGCINHCDTETYKK